MGTVAENKIYYAQYDWQNRGIEWSAPWGSTRAMWHTSLGPRVLPYLPADRVVEIGAGHGRIGRLLRQHVHQQLTLVDIMPECVRACENAFVDDPFVDCIVNDGETLPFLASESVDLAVSYYSLVGADINTLSAYTKEFARVLRDDGVAFIHHSNAAVYYEGATQCKRMQLLSAYRDTTVSAALMRSVAEAHDLVCIRQECVNWDLDDVLSDCFTTIARPSSKWSREPELVWNPDFRNEMNSARMRLQSKRRAMGARRVS